MTGSGPEKSAAASHGGGSGHLDEDPECLEDPVHCGDAQHQREHHAHDHPAVAPAEADPAQPD